MIEAVISAAPLLGRISNQFYEDLRKIAELRPLVKDIDLSRIDDSEKVYRADTEYLQIEKQSIWLKRADFGREFILP